MLGAGAGNEMRGVKSRVDVEAVVVDALKAETMTTTIMARPPIRVMVAKDSGRGRAPVITAAIRVKSGEFTLCHVRNALGNQECDLVVNNFCDPHSEILHQSEWKWTFLQWLLSSIHFLLSERI